LINFAETQDQNTLAQTFLVHGEETSMKHFKRALEDKGYKNIAIPEYKETFDL
jgi:metallo-beta-lactamase family protein